MTDPTKIRGVVFYDENGREVSKHDLEGMVLLGLPAREERIAVSTDPALGVPLLSIRAGEPMIVLNLMNVLSKMLPTEMRKLASELEKKQNAKN